MTLDLILFLILALVAVATALGMLLSRNAVYSALFLVLNLVTVAVFYLLLAAPFIAMTQITVYAGAIMVLFLFVIMLLNLGAGGVTDMRGWVGRGVAVLLGAGLVLQLGLIWRVVRADGFASQTAAYPLPAGELARLQEARGAVGMLADPLFRQYLVPFEVTSVLLLAAIVGAVVLAKRKI